VRAVAEQTGFQPSNVAEATFSLSLKVFQPSTRLIMNLAKLLEGPAVITHRGVSFHSRGGAVLTPGAENFPIETDAYGPISQRARENSIALALTPVGVWSAAVLAVLYRWRNAATGTLVTPRYDVSAIDTATDIVTLLGTGAPRAGCPIRWAAETTKPAAITLATTYFWGASGKIYDTEAHAITDDGTGKGRLRG
jgi:hypothetical protein